MRLRMENRLRVLSDQSEQLNYNIDNFQLYVKKGQLIDFIDYTAPCHWHYDLEFIYMLDGNMDFFVNGNEIKVEQGQAIFVNSRRLHYGYSKQRRDGTFIVITIHPSLIGNAEWEGTTYWNKKFGLQSEDYLYINGTMPWHAVLTGLMQQLYECIHEDNRNPFTVYALALQLCGITSDHISTESTIEINQDSWNIIRNMTSYIHMNYEHKLSLDHIASSGSVCRSKCCHLFSEYLNTTPNSYLNQIRIYESCKLLTETTLSISDIAQHCGFQSASYFTSIFKKELGLTPKQFRSQSTS